MQVKTKFQYIIIHPEAAKSKMIKKEIKQLSYDEVSKHFGIQE